MSNSFVNILGVSVNTCTKDEIIEKIKSFLSSKNQETVFTPNAEILYKASKDTEYKNMLNSASLLIPDGIGINLSMRILGVKSPKRQTGIDIAEKVISYASEKGLRIFLLGGKLGVAEKAKMKLEAKYKALTICGTSHGYFDKEANSAENKAIINKINQSKADIVFVCFGAPMQELWICRNSKLLPKVRLFMGLGGCLDVWSENIPRAPKIIRLFCLEWLFRAFQNPKRFKRLPTLFKFLFSVIKQKRVKRHKRNLFTL